VSARQQVFVSLTILGLAGAGAAWRQRAPAGRPSGSAAGADLSARAGGESRQPIAFTRAAFGVSGALRIREVLTGEIFGMPLRGRVRGAGAVAYRWLPVQGTPGLPTPWWPLRAAGQVGAPARQGVYLMQVRLPGEDVTLEDLQVVVEVPFERVRAGYLGAYHVGQYPVDQRRRYAWPVGFIEVTPANEELPLSEHLRLRQFLTHDQAGAWPKYAVVDTRLLDKLELVLAELERMGVPAHRLYVMSGYRTPQYNRRGLGHGRAVLSRHQYGDAADVWVDDDGDGYMDDLNGDGRRDIRDAAVMLRAVARVEGAHPELVGGAGTYSATARHGPFVHIDARGRRARWGGAAGE